MSIFFNNKYQIMGLFTYRQWKLANGHAKITAVIVKHPVELHGSLLTLKASLRYNKQKTASDLKQNHSKGTKEIKQTQPT